MENQDGQQRDEILMVGGGDNVRRQDKVSQSKVWNYILLNATSKLNATDQIQFDRPQFVRLILSRPS